jgi:hypothetical protein
MSFLAAKNVKMHEGKEKKNLIQIYTTSSLEDFAAILDGLNK